MKKLKLGIIGLGNMGRNHLVHIRKNPRVEVVAVCDRDPAVAAAYPDQEAKQFPDTRALLESGLAEAVLVCTHHSDHVATGVAVLESGAHLLMEKPLALSKGDCETLIAAHRNPNQVFAIMLNQRTDLRYRWAKGLIETGDLGSLMRMQWTITDWFRTEFYFQLVPWFATWSAGGGLVMTQALHQLDILIWLCGMPKRVHAHAGFGKWHDVPVDDEVTAYLEFDGKASGVFISSTGETPGTNCLEICGDAGRIVIDEGGARFQRNGTPAGVLRRTVRDRTVLPDVTVETGPDKGEHNQHAAVIDNFVDAVLDGAPLLARAAEGMRSVELANAILLSSVTGEAVDLPMDAARYDRFLARMIAAEAPAAEVVRNGQSSAPLSS